jgi:hypothetical protein
MLSDFHFSSITSNIDIKLQDTLIMKRMKRICISWNVEIRSYILINSNISPSSYLIRFLPCIVYKLPLFLIFFLGLFVWYILFLFRNKEKMLNNYVSIQIMDLEVKALSNVILGGVLHRLTLRMCILVHR